jgi:hypothetical protein
MMNRAAMARLNEGFVELPSDGHDSRPTNTRVYPRTFVELHQTQFFVVAYVQMADTVVSQDRSVRAVPARLKLDTGADIDHVSREFLNGPLSMNDDSLIAIPEEEQCEVIGFEGTTYTPKHRVKLRWSREIENGMKEMEFLVVEGCPCDIVLGSRRFLEEATRRTKRVQVVARPDKPKGNSLSAFKLFPS